MHIQALRALTLVVGGVLLVVACSSSDTGSDVSAHGGNDGDGIGTAPVAVVTRTTCLTVPSPCKTGEVCATFGGARIPYCSAFCEDDPSICGADAICAPSTNAPNRSACMPKCKADNDCADGFSCDASSGKCSCGSDLACTKLASSPAVCGEGGICKHACKKTDDCRCGSVCSNDIADAGALDASTDASVAPDASAAQTGGVCNPGCTSDTDCCGVGQCIGGRCATGLSGPAGSRCAAYYDCTGDQNCYQEFARWQCGANRAGSTCESSQCKTGSTCQSLWDPSKSAYDGACLIPCQPGGTECTGKTVCSPTANGGAACMPRCDEDQDCGPYGACELGTGRCKCTGDPMCQNFGSRAHCDATAGACICQPDCTGKACGPDGCGGWCGTCGAGLSCKAGVCSGTCGSTTPNVVCSDGECPANGGCLPNNKCSCNKGFIASTCDGTACTNCTGDWQCKACVPACGGRTCGGDGCGGSCGACPTGSACSSAGQCITGGGSSSSGGTTSSSGGTSSGGGTSSSSGGSATCHSRQSCVAVSSRAKTGPGSCSGEVVATITNSCGDAVACNICATKNGVVDRNGCELQELRSGQTLSGEGAGLWWCDASGVSYVCSAVDDPSPCRAL